MSDISLLRSPLAGLFAGDYRLAPQGEPGVSLVERPFLGYLNLRTEPAADLVERIEHESGIRLPVEPNTFTEAGETIALWLAPNEWLLVTPPKKEATLSQTIAAAAQNRFFSLTDVTHGNTTIRVHGPRAIQMLNKGCSLDLVPSVSRATWCAQTLLAKAHIILRVVNDPAAFDLIVRRSFAEYLALWLRDASLEYGFAVP
jgi:sarcosine oxidase, subunit gamma